MAKLIDLDGLAYFYGKIKAMLAEKLGKNDTAAAALKDGAGNNIVDTYAKKTDISGMVKSVNGTAPDAGGNVNVEEYTHPNSGVTAGTYRSVTVNAQGHVTGGSNPTLAITDGGTGANNASQACANIGAVRSVNGIEPDNKGNVEIAGVPVGFEYFSTNPNIPAGSLPLLGGEYSRTAYADLWAWVQTQQGYLIEEAAWQAKADANGGNVPFYSKGNGSTTFRVPALKCWVRGAGSISEVGGYLAAGLPNLTGTTKAAYGENNQTTNVGALQTDIYTIGSANGRQDGGNGSDGEPIQSAILTFNASKSNSIYGSSDTVQPPSIVGMWLVKAYGTVTNVGSTDVANLAQGLTQTETRISALETNKVDKAGNAWVVESYRNGTEWYRVWSDGWVEQGGYLTESSMPLVFTITFLKAFADTNYTHVIGATSVGTSTYANGYYSSTTKATTNIGVHVQSAAENFEKNCRVDWYACGQGA